MKQIFSTPQALADVVKLNVFLTDLAHFPKVSEIMAQYFAEPYPACALVEADAMMVPG
jgi:enamine deaminase RidA (YjgF/YER057c/UK114 family)